MEQADCAIAEPHAHLRFQLPLVQSEIAARKSIKRTICYLVAVTQQAFTNGNSFRKLLMFVPNACLCSSGLAELAQWKKKDVSICKIPLSYDKKITNS